jgi:pyruvate dehydrogenase E2 component (dihydrolipoamide acetyltransferase)
VSEVEVRVPDLGDTQAATVVEVLVAVGAQIGVEDPLITLESEKASMDIPSSAAGTVLSISVKKGQEVSSGTVIAVVTSAKSEAAPEKKVAPENKAEPEHKAEPQQKAEPKQKAEPEQKPAPEAQEVPAKKAASDAKSPASPAMAKSPTAAPPAKPSQATPRLRSGRLHGGLPRR